MPDGAVQSIIDQTDAATQTYVQNVWTTFDTAAQPLILAVATIALVMVGYLMLTGRVRANSPEFLSRLIRWTVIFVLLLNMPGVYGLAYPLVTAVPATIAQFLLTQAPTAPDEDQVIGMIESVMEAGIEGAGRVWQDASYFSLTPYIISSLLLLTALLLAIVATVLLILSKLAVGILLAVAPFFLGLRLLDVGKGLFEGWLRQLLTFALVPIFVYSLIALNFTILEESHEQLTRATQPGAIVTLSVVVPFVLVGIANLVLLTQVLGWAGGVGGGIALAVTAGAVIAGVSQAARYTYATGRAATQATVAGSRVAAGAVARYGPGIVRRMGTGTPW